MSLKQVLSKQPMDISYWYRFLHQGWVSHIFFIVLLILFIFLFVFINKNEKNFTQQFFMGGFGLSLSGIILVGFFYFLVMPFSYTVPVEQVYINHYVKPYISSLPTLKTSTFNRLKIDNADPTQNNVVISYKGNPITLENIPIKLDLKSTQKPYISFKYCPYDFSDIIKNDNISDNPYEKGVHHAVIHLPLNYKIN